MKLLKKYWFGTSLLLLWFAVLVFFDPAQREFYLVGDLDKFAGKANLVLILLECILLGRMLVLAIRYKGPIKDAAKYVAYGIALLLIFFIFFHETFTDVGLFINRQIVRSEVKRNYVVGYLNDDKRDTSSLFLLEVGQKESTNEKNLVDQVRHLGFNSLDTIQVGFKKGLFGVDFFDNPSIRRK